MAVKEKVKLKVLHDGPAKLDGPLTLLSAPARSEDVPAFDPTKIRVEGRALRASSYNIYVDLPESRKGEMLLVHGYTGAYDKVSRRVATYVRSLEARPAPKPLYGSWSPEEAIEGVVLPPSVQTIATLHRRGYLTMLSVEEEEALFSDIAAKLHFRDLHGQPGYILMPTYQCNLRCAYCFQDHMRTNPEYRHLLRFMDRAMVDRIFKGMRNIEAAHGVPGGADASRNIILFGGEPLLRESRPIVEYIVQKAFALGKASFSAVSNATELDAYRDLLGPEGISFVQITIDGPPREHDKRRIYADGSGSFERIAANVTMALELGVAVSLRMNVDRGNIVHLPALAAEFAARGWAGHPGFSAHVAPIHASGENVDRKTTFDSWKLRLAMEELTAQNPIMASLEPVDGGLMEGASRIFEKRVDPLPSFRTSFCGAHTTMYVIDPFGDIYACWERTGDPSIRIGAIREDGEVAMNSAVFAAWRRRNVTSNPVCRKCRYAMHCGGGCAVLAEGQHGTIYANHCDGFGKRFRAQVAEAYVAHVSGVKRENKTNRVCNM
ncbi:radical SAM protein [Polyangium sp. 6x1]|uniref:radical SAM/SPASM domain-containing protein n=1 Tax=Polyangium sp. 6x1 TaxID=3042689 RepID=UPI0024827C53|nr:radical SAM protein [Polyangium sp. 6x1]MDI1451083.1 radical SAM protein [Polyangium sp. 6x1]